MPHKPQHSRSRAWPSYDNEWSIYGAPSGSSRNQSGVHQGWSWQTTISQGNNVGLLGRTRRDIGGPFSTVWNEFRSGEGMQPVHLQAYIRGYQMHFEGSQSPVANTGLEMWPVTPVHDLTEMTVMGMQAIARTTPTKANAELLNTLVELRRDGIPSIPGVQALKRRTAYAKSAGDEYLNAEFGWRPLINDLRKMLKSVRATKSATGRAQRSMRVDTRARYSFPSTTDVPTWVSSHNGQYPYPQLASVAGSSAMWGGGSKKGTRTVIRYSSDKTWFEGKYSHYVPIGDDLASRIDRFEQDANKLLGTRLTPEVVWEAAPWTWLVDYVVDVGSLVTNASNFLYDGLVLRYGYLMRTSHEEHRHTLVGPVRQDGVNRWEASFTTTRKTRIPANPYGFGIEFDGLSGRQVAILVALGLSRSSTAR